MSNSLFPLAGIKRCIFSVFLLGFRTFYPLHVLQPHKIIPLETTQLFLLLQRVLSNPTIVGVGPHSLVAAGGMFIREITSKHLMMDSMGLRGEPLWFKSH